MKFRNLAVVLCGLLLLGVAPGFAQGSGEQIYLHDAVGDEPSGWALGFSYGLVDLGDNVFEGDRLLTDDDVESYLTLSLRIPFGNRSSHGRAARSGFRGYLEPELAHWDGDFQSDTLLGINILGGMPYNAVEFFVGGGIGIHSTSRDDVTIDNVVIMREDDESLGVNAQFGVDVSVSDHVALFGVGRFDLIDDDRDELEGKASVGIRFRF